MDPPNSLKPQYPTQRRARFVDTSQSKSRSRSRSRQRSRRDREPSRRRRYSSSSDGESPSGIQRTQQAQRQAHSPSHKQSTQEAELDASNPGHDKIPGSSGKASYVSNSNHDKKIENSNIVGSRMLVGTEVEYPQTESLIALFLKSMMGSGKTVSNKFSSRELLNQALSHPKEAGKLLNVVSKMQSQPLNTEDAPKVVLHDPTVQGGIATTRAISLVNTNATDFQPFEIDYPIPLLAKRLYREQKMHHKGSPFGFQAWINFHEIPPWCQQYIREFLEHGSNENHFWSLLIVDPIYKKSKSWTGRFRSVEKLHCKRLKETPSQGAKDELIDALAGRLAEPLSDLVGDVWERSKRRRMENRSSRPRSPTQRRSRSRSRPYDPNIVSYGSASVANHNRPFPSSSTSNIQTPAPYDLGYTYQNPNGDQSADVTQSASTYQGVNAYTPSNIYQPPTSYQDANPYQSTHPPNQTNSYQPGNPYQSAIPSYGEPAAQAYGVTERQDLVHADIDDDGIDANIPDDQLTREVMARYTGAWQMDENGVAHEENDESRGEAHRAQPPSIVEVADDDLNMV